MLIEMKEFYSFYNYLCILTSFTHFFYLNLIKGTYGFFKLCLDGCKHSSVMHVYLVKLYVTFSFEG